MDAIENEAFSLEDHLNKCRCCLRTLIDEQKIVKITRKIEENFYSLTQIQLVEADVFSDKICQLCNNDLEVFSQFRKDLTKKQTTLYNVLAEKNPEFASRLFVKSELNEFIDCNPNTKDEDPHHPQVIIKSEVDEIEALDASQSWNKDCGKSKAIHCKLCNFKCKNRKYLADHIENYHNIETVETESDDKSCPVCGITVKELDRHIKRVHLNIKNFQCDQCSFASYSKTEMELHVIKTHATKEASNFFCEFCSKEFSKRHLLNRHIKLKHTEKQRVHQCSLCDKSFFTISTLKKHVESHRAKDMPCEFCGKLFSCMNNLRTHLYYHYEPKFICEFENCDKRFFMRKLLKAHMNVHRGQKDFMCNYCEKSYFFQSHLKRHIISTHMKLKIDCEVMSCSSSFARKETYRNHVLSHHQAIGSEALETLLTKIRNMKVEDYRCVG